MMIGVYEIRNLTTDECYIGVARAIAARWTEHLNALARGSHPNPKLQRAWEEHGAPMFAFRVLVQAETEEAAYAIEDDLIRRLQPAYNQHLVDPPTPRRAQKQEKVNYVCVGYEKMDESALYIFRCPCCNEPHMVMFDRPEPYVVRATQELILARWMEAIVTDHFDPPWMREPLPHVMVGAETP